MIDFISSPHLSINIFAFKTAGGCQQSPADWKTRGNKFMDKTIEDIAQKAGVSTATVSRVLNNKPDVNDETKKKIEKIIKEEDYMPNGIARGLAKNKTLTIGLIIPDISNPYFPEIVRGSENQSKKMGYSLIFCETQNNKKEEKRSIDLMRSKRVDGILLSLSKNNKQELIKLQEDQFPFVQIDRFIPEIQSSCVIINNVNAACKAVNYLIKKGHKKIAHVTGDLKTQTGIKRKEGYQKVIQENNLKIKNKWIKQGDYTKKSGYESMKSLLDLSEKPTAVYFANDLMALGGYKAAEEKNFKIPDNISIVGHDNIDIASLIKPALTTVAQPMYKLGIEAAKLLIKNINEKENDYRHKILSTKLIERESTAEVR